jgi:DNA-binding CsgD family transcriptional regulator
MSIRYRPMRPSDVHECVEIVATHPILGPRYGGTIADLGAAWLRLLYSDGFGTSAVFEDADGATANKLAVGVSVFVTDDFMRELKTPPSFWIGPELTRRVMRGNAPLLSPRHIAEANTQGGLTALTWEVAIRPEVLARLDVINTVMMAYHASHSGFRLNEIAAQAESPKNLDGMRHTGGLLWKFDESKYSEFWQDDVRALVRKPHLSGMTHTLAQGRACSWLSSLFLLYQPPRIGFSRSEQRLLISAMQGSTDQELSDEMAISVATVKKTWLLIYARVAARMPELIPPNSPADDGANRRGREKKQRLIAYLREHPEELRPVSRKALQAGVTRPSTFETTTPVLEPSS